MSELAERYARLLLSALELPETEATKDTPRRLVKAFAELTSGLRVDPTRHLAVTFPPEAPDPGMIIVTGVPFISVCEHHMLPFTGTAAVAYLPEPDARIVGLSKLARLVTEYAARPQVQERLGQQITTALDTHLVTMGAACLLRSSHTCMTLRGVRAVGSQMVTSHLTGMFKDEPTVRAEFLSLTHQG